MYFRPFPVLTLFAVPILAALIALGVWQAQRAEWKAALLQSFAETAEAPPLTSEAVCTAGLAEGQVIAPPVGQGPGLRMFGHDASGSAGWRVFQAADMCGRPVLVESSFERLMIGGPGGQLPAGAIPERKIDRFVVEPWPERSAMAAANSVERNEWHWFDPAAIVDAVGSSDLNTGLIVVPYAGVPAFLSRTPPETHIGYAVTWFGMAVALMVIYAVFHARAGRLRFGRTKA